MPEPRIWFSSDHHFGHDAIRRYSKRPYHCVEQMDEEMLRFWNNTVGPQDIVFYLGDLAFMKADATRALLAEMNGRIRYIRGNHDKQMKGKVLDRFEWVKDYYRLRHTMTLEGEDGATVDLKVRIILCHYPFETWDQAHHGTWHLHGHSHGSLRPRGGRLDVGVDSHFFTPWSLEQVAEYMLAHPYQAIDHHRRD